MNRYKITLVALACLMALPAPAMQLPSFAHFAFSKSKLAWGISALAGLGALAYFAYKYKWVKPMAPKPIGIIVPKQSKVLHNTLQQNKALPPHVKSFSFGYNTHIEHTWNEKNQLALISTQPREIRTMYCNKKNSILAERYRGKKQPFTIEDLHTGLDTFPGWDTMMPTDALKSPEMSTAGVFVKDGKLTLFSYAAQNWVHNKMFFITRSGDIKLPFNVNQDPSFHEITYTLSPDDEFLVLLSPAYSEAETTALLEKVSNHKDNYTSKEKPYNRDVDNHSYVILGLKHWVKNNEGAHEQV